MDADTHRGYAMHLMILMRFDQARNQAKLAQRLDPVSFAVNEGKEIVELHRCETPARASFARVSTLLAQRPTVDAGLDGTHLAALNQQSPDAKRLYEDILRLSTSTYISPTMLSMLKGAVYGFKGEMFAVAYKEHDPSLLWCRYLEGTAGSDLPAVIRKMGLN